MAGGRSVHEARYKGIRCGRVTSDLSDETEYGMADPGLPRHQGHRSADP